MYLVLTLIVLTFALILAYLKNNYSYWARRGVPHEKPVYIFGNLKGIGRTIHFRDVTSRIYQRFKHSASFAGIYMFLSKSAIILDLDLIKQILIKDFSNFHDRNIFHNVRDDPLTGHLLTLQGAEWRAMRNKLSPVFTSGKVRFMFPTLRTVAENLSKTCGDLATKDSGNTVEIKELCACYTTDVIGTCAFGIECNSLKDPNAEFREKGRSVFGKPRHSQIVQAFMITNPKLARKLRMKLLADDVSEFFMNAVRSTVDYRIKNNVKRNDFMDMLIEMKAQDEELAKEGKGIDLTQGLTLEQMAAQAFVFFVAGFDTSSSTMAFCLYELALNTDVQHKLREEINTILKKYDNKLDYDAIKEMIYLEQVLNETLRKYPIIPNLVRDVTANFKVPGSSFVLEKGLTILIPVWAIHHDPELYPDPEKFDPSRFDKNEMLKRHQCAFLPFGDGPRNCIGMRFGKMQSKIGLISLLRSYKFECSDLTEVPLKLSKKNFFNAAENGIHLKVEPL